MSIYTKLIRLKEYFLCNVLWVEKRIVCVIFLKPLSLYSHTGEWGKYLQISVAVVISVSVPQANPTQPNPAQQNSSQSLIYVVNKIKE